MSRGPLAVASVLALACAMLGLAASAQTAAPVEELRVIEEERGRIEHLLRRLDDRREQVLDLLEETERAWRAAKEAEEAARRRAAEAQARHEAWLSEEERLSEERLALARELAPRLKLRYRLREGAGPRALMNAPSIGDFLWRRRMLDRVLQGDLEIAWRMEEITLTAREARESAAVEREALVQAEAEARDRAAAAEVERSTHRELLARCLGEAAHHRRAIAELERSRHRLLEAIAAMPPTPEGLGGFGARRGRLPLPATGEIEAGFGRHVDPRSGMVTYRKGIDLRAKGGTPVRTPHPAAVGFAGWFHGFGKLVVLDHGEGYYTLYGHLDELAVERGERVGAGAVVGTVGDTGSLKGAFLYFEIRSGQRALDPAEWLKLK